MVLLTHIGAISNPGLKTSSLLIVPPHPGMCKGCVATGGALVTAVVPFRSHLGKQRLQGVADANFPAGAAWASSCIVHVKTIACHLVPMGSRKWLEGTPNLYAASVIVTAGVLHDSQGVSIAQCQILE